ncbi:MAG: hypothetical protein WC955_09960 [Elusimicrobiota bacterium]
MKLLYYALSVIAAIVLSGVAYFAVVGGFDPVVVSEKDMGPYTIVYEEHIGDYSETGKVHDKIFNSLTADGINTTKGIGIYYDNPQIVAKDKLRSELGCILEETDLGKTTELAKKYKIKLMDKQYSAVAELNLKSKLTYMIGAMKAYPALNKYIQDNKLTSLSAPFELYDIPAKKIYYVIGVKK